MGGRRGGEGVGQVSEVPPLPTLATAPTLAPSPSLAHAGEGRREEGRAVEGEVTATLVRQQPRSRARPEHH